MNSVSPEFVYAVSNYVLLVIILGTFVKYLLFKDKIDAKSVQKIIGGLAAFEVALVSRNSVIIFVSLFIGGLIIASEDFMHKLAIIMRSRSEDIGKNLSTTNASASEVEKKHKEEVKKIKTLEKKTRGVTLSSEEKKVYEAKITDYLESQFNEKFEKNVKITSPDGVKDTVVDGVIKDDFGHILSVVEVLYVHDTKSVQNLIIQANEKVRSVSLVTHLTLLFVSNKRFTKTDIEKLLSWNSSIFEVSVGLFEVKKGVLQTLVLPFIPGIDYF